MADREIPAGTPAPGIQVIGAGFGRTGTASLKQALEDLGFEPCDHMHENFDHPERFARWSEALRRKDAGEPIDWRPLLSDYRAVVDWPGAYFWRELASAHPHAKVVLTVRDPERWCDSIQSTIFPLLHHLTESRGESLPGDVIVERTFARQTADRAHCTAVFAAHNQSVREAIGPDRLLVFDVKEGWVPLCGFLGVPVPVGAAFPHLNDTAEFQADERKRID
jgi:Sulfotransferase domain